MIKNFHLTQGATGAIIQINQKTETVEAEITAEMPLQRVCDAESQARNISSNGPLRAQSNIGSLCEPSEYSAT